MTICGRANQLRRRGVVFIEIDSLSLRTFKSAAAAAQHMQPGAGRELAFFAAARGVRVTRMSRPRRTRTHGRLCAKFTAAPSRTRCCQKSANGICKFGQHCRRGQRCRRRRRRRERAAVECRGGRVLSALNISPHWSDSGADGYLAAAGAEAAPITLWRTSERTPSG